MSKNSCNTPRPVASPDVNSITISTQTPANQEHAPSVGVPADTQAATPVIDHPSLSAGNRLLTALWATPGLNHQIATLDRQTHRFSNQVVGGPEDALDRAQRLSREGHDVFFACAEYLTPDNRQASNAAAARAFWMDIDCGKDKVVTGKGYATIEDAKDALGRFRETTGLPMPTHTVQSGSGLHVYWALNAAVSREDWQSHARQLKALTKACGFRADDSRTADIASVLRIPGTLNHKASPPRPVTLTHAADDLIDRSEMLRAIASAHNRLCTAAQGTPGTGTDSDQTPTVTDIDRPDLTRLTSALTALDPDCDEQTWKLKRLAPLAGMARQYPELAVQLKQLAIAWSSGVLCGKASKAWTTPGGNGQTGEAAFETEWQRFQISQYTGNPATLGTIFYDAKQAGWSEANQTTAGNKDEKGKDRESGNEPFPMVEPHPDPIEPAELLSDIAATIRRFIVMEPEQADAATLWVASTWFIDTMEVAPLAVINAPERACGKSQLLDVMGRMSLRPLPVSNTSTAALFRSVELWGPTLLIDEADTFTRSNDELKGIINAGHTRANAFVLRVVGQEHEPKRFSVWCPKALAGITLERHLPDSTMSRAIVFNLRRKLPHEKVERLRHAEPGLFERLASKLARLAQDHAEAVRRSRPELPEALSDRAQDNWEPLLAIASCAGPDWLARATRAALKLSGASEEGASTGSELLSDIQQVFETKGAEKIRTADLIAALVADEEMPWATYNRGKPLTPRQLAKQLSAYGIRPKTVRFDKATPKGYEAAQFADAFARYVTPAGSDPKRGNEAPNPNNGETDGVADGGTVAATTGAHETPKPAPTLESFGVADGAGSPVTAPSATLDDEY